MKHLVYHIICPPGWVKTAPLAPEYIRRYAMTEGIDVKPIDLNIALFKASRTEAPQWLKLNDEFEHTLFENMLLSHVTMFKALFRTLADCDAIAFSLYRRNRFFVASLIEEIAYAYPDKKIVIGGPHTRWMELQGETFDSRFSWVIGEGEQAISNVLNSSAPVRIRFDELSDLDAIPFLDFAAYDLSLYSPTLPLLSSRGCIHQCAFCTERLLTKTFRQHSPQYMADQIELLHRTYGRNTFSFQDSLINADSGWLESFCRKLIEKKIDIIWEAQAAISPTMPTGLMRLMKQSGCYNLFIGLESACDRTLKRMNKGFTRGQALVFLKNLHQAQLHYEISLIAGYPGEDETSFEETYEFIRTHKNLIPKIAQVNPYLDYLAGDLTLSGESLKRIERLVAMFKEERIRYTKSFINNLMYENV